MDRVLIVCDRPAWAFDAIARQLVTYNDRNFKIEVTYAKGNTKLEDQAAGADLVFFMHWSLFYDAKWPSWRVFGEKRFANRRLAIRYPSIDPAKVIAGIHAHHDYDDRRSLPDNKILPPDNLVKALSRFKAVNAVSKRLVRFFSEAGLSTVVYTANGVDHEAFCPTREPGDDEKLVVGSSGTKKRDWKEGITEFIEPIAGLDFVELRIAIPQEGKYVPHEEMPDFLNGLDVYVCASATEGFPLKVLEACACGRPVLTTRVGGCEDMIRDGETGYFIGRDRRDITERLNQLNADRDLLKRIGRANRAEIEQNWTWARRAPDWLDFIEANL